MGLGIPQCSVEQYETAFSGRHLLHEVISYWALRKPDEPAIIHHDRGVIDSWAALEEATNGLAVELLRMGFRKGDFLATSLPFLREHILLEYACFKIGVVHAPLDLRLGAQEVLRSVSLIRARGYCFLGQTKVADFRELGRAVQRHCPSVEHLIQMSADGETIDGARSFASMVQGARAPASDLRQMLDEAASAVRETDGAQVIFTTGSTGEPKPALLTHRSITAQNMCLSAAFFREDQRVLINLPPSHVGGQAELLMTTLFAGATAVVLEIFDAVKSLVAIERHKVTLLGQIPAMFQLEWRLSDFASYDLSSLETAVYGGQQVNRPFLEKLAATAPAIGTGLGLTEASGFCTYTVPGVTIDETLASIGHDMPAYRLTIRELMREDGSAGAKLPDGEIGSICFEGPQTFAGYVNDPESTRKVLSTDGVLYTGDLGSKDDRGLHFSGREKWVIKTAGYQVFPGQIEAHFCSLTEKVAACGAVGVEHELFGEAIVAFVEQKPGANLTLAELKKHARSLTGYMRPLRYVILGPGELPLNRAAKTDYGKLSRQARKPEYPDR